MSDCICDPETVDGYKFVQWIGTFFGDCIYTPLEKFSYYSGVISILFYFIAFYPQIIENYRRKSTDGLSLVLIIIWFFGDFANYIGTVLTEQYPIQKVVGIYFALMEVIIIVQYVYYKFMYKGASVIDDDDEDNEPTETDNLIIKTEGDKPITTYDSFANNAIQPPSFNANTNTTLSSSVRSRSSVTSISSKKSNKEMNSREVPSVIPPTNNTSNHPYYETLDEISQKQEQIYSAAALNNNPVVYDIASNIKKEEEEKVEEEEQQQQQQVEQPEEVQQEEEQQEVQQEEVQQEVQQEEVQQEEQQEEEQEEESSMTTTSAIAKELENEEEQIIEEEEKKEEVIIKEEEKPKEEESEKKDDSTKETTEETVSVSSPRASKRNGGKKKRKNNKKNKRGKKNRAKLMSQIQTVLLLSLFIIQIQARAWIMEDESMPSLPNHDEYDVPPMEPEIPRRICNASPNLSISQKIFGSIMAWSSGILYFTSRIPQILDNRRNRSVEGLSVLLFICTICGNLFYGLSILTRFPPIDEKFFAGTLPYLIGSVGTFIFDILIVYQFNLYKKDSNANLPNYQPLLD